jgi:hypothetical protein
MPRWWVNRMCCEATMSSMVTSGNRAPACLELLEGDEEIPLASASIMTT